MGTKEIFVPKASANQPHNSLAKLQQQNKWSNCLQTAKTIDKLRWVVGFFFSQDWSMAYEFRRGIVKVFNGLFIMKTIVLKSYGKYIDAVVIL